MIKQVPLECTVHFLSEQRTELYKKYCSGVAEVKNVLCAKKPAKFQVLRETVLAGGSA